MRRRFFPNYSVDPLLEGLLVLAVGVVVAQRALRAVPEFFPGGAVLGEVFAALALSYIGAWFFNLLVIRLPKQKDKIAVVTGSGNLIARYASTAVGIFQIMASRAGNPEPPRQPDADYLHKLFSDVAPGAEAPMHTVHGVQYNWLQFCADAIERAAGIKARLTPLFPYLEAETVSAVAAIENQTIYQILPVQAQFTVANGDMLAFESMFFDLWKACAHLGDRYIAEIAPLLEPGARVNIDYPNGPPREL